MKKSDKIYDSMKQAAGALKVSLAEVRRAKRAGCDAFHNGRVHGSKLAAWLKANPRKRASAPATGDALAQGVGASHALERLEQSELHAYKEWRAALATGDLEAIDAARRAWLQVGECLRKHDLALEADRRSAGQLVPRAGIETMLKCFGWMIRISIFKMTEGIVTRLTGLKTHLEVHTILQTVTFEKFVSSLACLNSNFPDHDARHAPPWALQAMGDDLGDQKNCIANRTKHFQETARIYLEMTERQALGKFPSGQPEGASPPAPATGTGPTAPGTVAPGQVQEAPTVAPAPIPGTVATTCPATGPEATGQEPTATPSPDPATTPATGSPMWRIQYYPPGQATTAPGQEARPL